MLCPRCGTPNRREASRCVRCGVVMPLGGGLDQTDLDAPRVEPPSEAPRPARARRPAAPGDSLGDGPPQRLAAQGTAARTPAAAPNLADGRPQVGSLAGLLEKLRGPGALSHSSPWSERGGGALEDEGALDFLREEATQLGAPVVGLAPGSGGAREQESTELVSANALEEARLAAQARAEARGQPTSASDASRARRPEGDTDLELSQRAVAALAPRSPAPANSNPRPDPDETGPAPAPNRTSAKAPAANRSALSRGSEAPTATRTADARPTEEADDEDEPPPEQTRLGDLAGLLSLEDPSLTSRPVVGLEAQAGSRAGGGATVAAPGELAGLIADLERSAPERSIVPDEGRAAAGRPAVVEPVRAAGEVVRPARTREPEARASTPAAMPSLDRRRAETDPSVAAPPDARDGSRTAEGDLGEGRARLRAPAEFTNLDLSASESLMEPTRGFFLSELSMPGDPVSAAEPVAASESVASAPAARPAPPRSAGRTLAPLPKDSRAEARPPEPAGNTDQNVRVLELAPMGRRVLAAAVDALLLVGVVGVLALSGLLGEALSTWSWRRPEQLGILLVQGELTRAVLFASALLFAFSAASHLAAGRTPGKLLLGLRLAEASSGERPAAPRVVLRALLSLAGLALGAAGYLWLIVDRRRRTLHDLLSGTVVVRVER
jgi:uncharacterized RDD family membrane protein YckC